MNRASVNALNLGGVFLALALSVAAGVRLERNTAAVPVPVAVISGFALREHADGRRELKDASGTWVPLTEYRRIASGSTIADELLLEFVEPERIVSFTRYSEKNPDTAHRYAGKPQLAGVEDLETLLTLKPDLFVLNTLGTDRRAERIRERGIAVFDLGEMRGLSTYLDNARVLALLAGRPELGERYTQRFLSRLRRIAATLTQEQRKSAAYLSVFANQIYSGGRDTSYDDVLTHAGLTNLVAPRHRGWPALSREDVLELDPEWLVTHASMGKALCGLEGLERLSACRSGSIVELPPVLLSDPGSSMLVTAERIFEAVYGESAGE